MQIHLHDPMKGSATRLARIAVIYRQHARELERRVATRARAEPRTIEDACSFAWMQLITHPSIELDAPCDGALAWITRTAVREAWRLEATRARDELLGEAALRREPRRREQAMRAVDELAAQRARLDLVAQIPPRPRRFLLRHALGHGYREIAAQENASLTTTNKQIARARRLLRAIDAPQEPELRAADGVPVRAPATARQRAA